MAKVSLETVLQRTMKKLSCQRAKLVNTIEKAQAKLDKIDAIFAGAGISLGGVSAGGRRGVKVGGKAGAKGAGGRRSRGKFEMTGEESILAFVKKHGNPSAKEVNGHWAGEGRAGFANNALGRLVESGKLKRVKADDAKGSRYELA